jgi:DNA-directed RNA polymerase specialized sigma24 family protein
MTPAPPFGREVIEEIPVGTAKCYAHRGRSSLRERLAR